MGGTEGIIYMKLDRHRGIKRAGEVQEETRPPEGFCCAPARPFKNALYAILRSVKHASHFIDRSRSAGSIKTPKEALVLETSYTPSSVCKASIIGGPRVFWKLVSGSVTRWKVVRLWSIRLVGGARVVGKRIAHVRGLVAGRFRDRKAFLGRFRIWHTVRRRVVPDLRDAFGGVGFRDGGGDALVGGLVAKRFRDWAALLGHFRVGYAVWRYVVPRLELTIVVVFLASRLWKVFWQRCVDARGRRADWIGRSADWIGRCGVLQIFSCVRAGTEFLSGKGHVVRKAVSSIGAMFMAPRAGETADISANGWTSGSAFEAFCRLG